MIAALTSTSRVGLQSEGETAREVGRTACSRLGALPGAASCMLTNLAKMHFDFGSVLVFVGLAAAFLGATLALGKLVRPATPDARKGLVYECGETPLGSSWFNFNPRFYLVALVFLVFDVEVAFTYPVAVVLRRWVTAGRGAQAILEIAVFIAVLMLGLGYVLAKGDLAWASAAAGDEMAPDARTPPAVEVDPPSAAA